jgi:hypothetical protein
MAPVSTIGHDAFHATQAMAAATKGQNMAILVNLPPIPLWMPAEARQEFAQLVLQTLRLALQDTAGHISGEAPVDSGGLAQSFSSDPANQAGGIEIIGADIDTGITGRVFSSLPYAIVMEEGRRPGAPISRAGIDAIGLWAQRKLGLTAAEADEAKWAIATWIVAQGIEGRGYFQAGVDAARPRVEQMFAILGDQITVALVTPKGSR